MVKVLYLILKKKQAECVLKLRKNIDFYSFRGFKAIPKNILKERDKLFLLCKKYNKQS
jgi:hypothetical protein